MKRVKRNRKRLIIDLCLLLIGLPAVLAVCWLAFRVRPYRHWKPAAVTVQVTETDDNPFIDPQGMTQEARILPPEGFTRVPAGENSFLTFMRQQPLFENGSLIYDYEGGTLPNSNAAAVYALSVGDEGYQECADTVIRFWSEYLWATGHRQGRLCRDHLSV